MVTLRQLQYLLALEKTKNFVKASEMCHVTQPTLSMQIQQLEERLNAKLIERGSRGVILTPLGESVIQKAQGIMQGVSDIEELCRLSHEPLVSDLTMGVIPTVAPYYLPKILPQLHKSFPKLEIYLKEDQTEKLLVQLQNGHIDVALLALPVDDSFAQKVLYKEDFVVAMPNDHALAKKEEITIEDLTDVNLMLLEEGHCLRDQALEVCQIAGQGFDGADFRATSLETLKHMVASGLGVTLLPVHAVDENASYAVRRFSSPAPVREIGLAWRRTSVRKVEMDILCKELEGILKG